MTPPKITPAQRWALERIGSDGRCGMTTGVLARAYYQRAAREADLEPWECFKRPKSAYNLPAGAMVKQLLRGGLIYAKPLRGGRYGYYLTDAGREALR